MIVGARRRGGRTWWVWRSAGGWEGDKEMYEEKPALHTMAHIGATAGRDPRAEVGAGGQKAMVGKP
jgi:hypothetical protein